MRGLLLAQEGTSRWKLGAGTTICNMRDRDICCAVVWQLCWEGAAGSHWEPLGATE